jgi:hypothetical protein
MFGEPDEVETNLNVDDENKGIPIEKKLSKFNFGEK